MTTEPPLLSVAGITKRFGGVLAVNEVSFTVLPGTLNGLIGPNGSGKTTVFNMISGVYRPDAGKLTFIDRDCTGAPAHAISRLGIARTFQNLRLFKSMSVLENVLVGMGGHPHAGYQTFPWDPFIRPWTQRRADHRMREAALDLLHQLRLEDVANIPATSLSYGRQRRTELARALASRPQLLLLDEPAAGLNADEIRELDELLQRLVGQGITILMIEHDMRLVMGVCSQVTVLDHGVVIAHGAPEFVRAHGLVLEAYLGKEDS